MTALISQAFVLDSKIALEVQKTRVAIATRLYSNLVESYIRSSKSYNDVLALRKNKSADRKETAKVIKKVLHEQLKVAGLSEVDFQKLFDETKDGNTVYKLLLSAEREAFKKIQPELLKVPVYAWMKEVKGLGLRYSVKLIAKIRDIQRFPNPSKLRQYCGTAPGAVRRRGQEAHFDPELKGVLLGQISKNFLKNKSQYKKVYDEKKAYYLRLHPEAVAERPKGKKLTKEDWTKLKIHNYAMKAMMNRFLVDLWLMWHKSEGVEPPCNIYIASDPKHTVEPPIVPYPT